MVRPEADNGLHQGRQRDSEEDAPETPQSPEHQNGYNDGHRVQIDHFREQQGTRTFPSRA